MPNRQDPKIPHIQSKVVLRDALWDKTIFLLDVETKNILDLHDTILSAIIEKHTLSDQEKDQVQSALSEISTNNASVADSATLLFHKQIESLSSPIQIFIRFNYALTAKIPTKVRAQFAWILFSPTETHPFISSVAEFFKLAKYRWFRNKVAQVDSEDALINIYKEGLSKALNFDITSENELKVEGAFQGIKNDLKARLPFWLNDFKCGFNLKVLASILFMFFACSAPAVAFGALIDTLTDSHIGVIETILGTAICGIVWSFIGGQPLTIIGVTGPNVIFMGILYKLCSYLSIDYLGTCLWVGLWSMIFLFILAIFNASNLIKYISRFTDEIFASLISFIFMNEALKDIFGIFQDPQIENDSALFSLILAVGTFIIAYSLSRFRRSPYLRSYVREFLSDFGPTIALAIMTFIAFNFPEINIKTLNVPPDFEASIKRSWLVSPSSVPHWVWIASSIPAILLTVLIWVNQNITGRLINNSDHKLKKGTTYHWDIFVIGILIGILSLFGLPWTVGAAVPSINHVRSLLVTRHGKTIRAIETRISNLGVHTLLALSLFILPMLKTMPMAVFFGIFLFMGIGSLAGNQFMGRLRLWFLDPQLFEPTHHLRAVPIRIIHLYTGIQLICLAALWLVKESFFSILFPLFVAFLVPIRMLLSKYIEPEYVALLDLEETPEKFRDFGL